MTAAESGTYTDFANINLAGVLPDGTRRRGRCVATCCWRSSTSCISSSPATTCRSRASRPTRFIDAAGAGHPPGLRLPLGLQRRRGGRRADAQGKSVRGRPRGRYQRLRRGRRLRQGGLHPDRLLQPAQDPRARAERRRRPADRDAHSGPTTGRRRPSRRSTTSSPPGAPSSGTSLDIKLARQRPSSRPSTRHEMPAPFLSLITDDCIEHGLRLQRRRRALQHLLRAGRRYRYPDRQPGGAEAACLRRRARCTMPDARWLRCERLRRRRSHCACCCATDHPSGATTTMRPMT